ncbi:MAG: cyclopropane-fatty-acyl-phospholipid synthase family protein [Pseudomonadales bacterium]
MSRALVDRNVPSPEASFASWWARRVLAALSCLEHGALRIRQHGQEAVLGQGAPVVTVTVHRDRFYRRLALGGTVGAGEAYMDGDWDCDDLVALVQLLAANRAAQGALDGAATASVQAWNWLQHLARGNSRRGSRRNVSAHYDLSNAFFETFLDRHMMYSSAVYDRADITLEEASEAKLERLCRKLALTPGDHLLEVGSGWGGLAVYAAGHFGCRVTTVTISAAQFDAARARVRAAGLDDRVEVLLRDYRDLDGRYDKIVSVEMVEAVGDSYLDGFFATLGRLLAPHGLLALQAITIEDQRYLQALRSVDFIKKHIFPGSFIPCASRLVSSAAAHSGTVLVSLEDIGLDYAATLAEWRRRFEAARPRILELGFDERFLRMWRFYLAYCEGGFRERAISDVQMLFAGPAYRGRPWRATDSGAAGAREVGS